MNWITESGRWLRVRGLHPRCRRRSRAARSTTSTDRLQASSMGAGRRSKTLLSRSKRFTRCTPDRRSSRHPGIQASRHPGIQASRHPGIQASRHPGRRCAAAGNESRATCMNFQARDTAPAGHPRRNRRLIRERATPSRAGACGLYFPWAVPPDAQKRTRAAEGKLSGIGPSAEPAIASCAGT